MIGIDPESRVTHFGTSAKYLSILEQHNVQLSKHST